MARGCNTTQQRAGFIVFCNVIAEYKYSYLCGTGSKLAGVGACGCVVREFLATDFTDEHAGLLAKAGFNLPAANEKSRNHTN
jgi:hypothetical protein